MKTLYLKILNDCIKPLDFDLSINLIKDKWTDDPGIMVHERILRWCLVFL